MLNLTLRAMRGGCSTSSVFLSFFWDSAGLPLAVVYPNDTNLWVNNNADNQHALQHLVVIYVSTPECDVRSHLAFNALVVAS